MCVEMIAALDLSPILWWIDVILKVAIGLGAVIFVHELGHFLVAKACGVKVEKFMIGFDIGGYKLSWRRGETEYGIGILPLGGYVKMLGQDDDPAHIAEQMQKSQVTASSPDGVQITGPKGEKYYVDRRSYLAKSVPQRMAIISAGVIMNVMFGFIFATIAYGMGVPYVPSIVSETVPGSPAWEAALEPGDEIVQIGDQLNPSFTQLRGGVTLGDLEEGIPVVVRRAEDGKDVRVSLTPRQKNGGLATIGVTPAMSLTLLSTIEHTPAASAKLIEPPAVNLRKGKPKLSEGDTIIRVGDVEVSNYRRLSAQLAQHADEALRITVRRPLKDDNSSGAESAGSEESQELVFELPPQPLKQLGVVIQIGPIVSVRKNSPAAEAGLQEGDLIEAVDGKRNGEGGDDPASWNVATLPEYSQRAALEGRTVEFTVRRTVASGGEDETFKINVTPEVSIMVSSPLPRPAGTPMGAEAVGIAYQIENEPIRESDDAPPANAGILPNDTIHSAKVVRPPSKDDETPEPIAVQFVKDEPGWLSRTISKLFGGVETKPRIEHSWPTLFDAIQFSPKGTKVEFRVKRENESEARTVTVEPAASQHWFVATRGFWFEPVQRTRKAETLAEQVRYGWEETTEALMLVFRFLQKLGTQVPLTALGGPVTIAKVAGYQAAEGLPSLLTFLTMLSANLAVINFLPIPLLDGGHIVFLAYEGLRGRPANEKFVVALHTAGFLLIVTLMLYVLALDFGLIPRNL